MLIITFKSCVLLGNNCNFTNLKKYFPITIQERTELANKQLLEQRSLKEQLEVMILCDLSSNHRSIILHSVIIYNNCKCIIHMLRVRNNDIDNNNSNNNDNNNNDINNNDNYNNTSGRKINFFFSGSHLAPKYFKVVANSKKLVAIMTHAHTKKT